MFNALKKLLGSKEPVDDLWNAMEKMDPLLSYRRFQALSLTKQQRPLVKGLIEGTLKPVDVEGVEEWAERNDENGEGINAIVYALQQVMESREVTYLFEDQVPVPTARFPSLKDKRAMTVLFNDRETHLQITSLEEFVAANGIDEYVLEALDLEQLRNRMTGRVRRYVGKEAAESIEADRADKRPRVSITIERQADGDEQLAAPVEAADIAHALKAEGHEVGADNLELDSPIEKLGLYKATARLDPETELRISVWVVPALAPNE